MTSEMARTPKVSNQISSVSVIDSERNRLDIYDDREGIQVAHIGLVGPIASPKLLVRCHTTLEMVLLTPCSFRTS